MRDLRLNVNPLAHVKGNGASVADSEDESQGAGKHRVLIIDDDLGTRQTFALILRVEGFQAMTAATGEEGIELAKRVDFDVVVIDLRLTDMPGTDVVAALRDLCSARLVVVSAFLNVAMAVEAMKRGAFDVLEKPVDAEGLLTVVRTGACERDARLLGCSSNQPSYLRIISAPRSVVERWAGYVMRVCDATAAESNGDFKTLEEWARCVAVSYSTLCETSQLLGIRPLAARDFARVLNAVRGAIFHRCAPEVLLNVSNRRVLRMLSIKAGIDLEVRVSHSSLYEFLTNQRFIPEDSEALRLIRVFTAQWFLHARVKT